jgi:hypothetical protein
MSIMKVLMLSILSIAPARYSDLSDALVFTVRSVVKIVQQVPAP